MNRKKIFIAIFSWILVFLTLLMITKFSLEDDQKSTDSSDQIFDSVIKDETSLNKDDIKAAHRFIRKFAHLGIYMLLGFCLNNAFFVSFDLKNFFNGCLTIFFGFTFSIFDEFIIQGSTQGRTPMFTDVLIDFLGLLIGALILTAFVTFIKKINKKEISN